jgi:hypothetical protein
MEEIDLEGTKKHQGSGKAIASLVLGIVGIIAWIIPILGLPITIVGLVLGCKGRKSIRKKVAASGIILSIIGLVLSILNLSISVYIMLASQHIVK